MTDLRMGALGSWLLATAFFGPAHAGDDRALLDLATCHGSTLPASALSGEGEDGERLAAITQVFDDLDDPTRFRPSGYPAFWAPAEDTAVAGFPVQYLGISGYGIFEGPNLILLGAFDEVRAALETEAAVDYDDCRADGLLKVCTKEIAENQSRLLMSHPRDPAARSVLVCVEDVVSER